MFYSETLLSKTGPLARVWLSANLERKLSKTHILQSNIETSVGAIVGQDQAPMALRLSGQLLLGVVRIYSRKARYLLEDCNEALMKIKMAFRPGNVDLPAGATSHTAAQLTLPDVITELDLLLPDPTLDLGDLGQLPFDSDAHISSNANITLSDEFFLDSIDRGRGPGADAQDDFENGLLDDDLNLDVDPDEEVTPRPVRTTMRAKSEELLSESDFASEIGRRAPAPLDDDLMSDIRMDDAGNLGLSDAPKQPESEIGLEEDLRLGFEGDEDAGMGFGGDLGFVGDDQEGDLTLLGAQSEIQRNSPPLGGDATPRAQSPGLDIGRFERAESSPLSSVRSSVDRDLDGDIKTHGDLLNMSYLDDTLRPLSEDPEPEPAVHHQRSVRGRRVLIDDVTEIRSNQIKAQQEDRSKILKEPSFLPRDPTLLALLSLQKSRGFAQNVFYPKNIAPELASLLSPEFVKRMAELKRKREDLDEVVAGEARSASKQPRLNIDEEEEVLAPMEEDERAGSGDEGGAGDEMFMLPEDETRVEHELGDDTLSIRGAEAEFAPTTPGMPMADEDDQPPTPGPEEESHMPPTSTQPISKQTQAAVHLLREQFSEPIGKKSAKFLELLPHATTTRTDATKMFFEVLVLATKDAISVKQTEGFGDISIKSKKALWGEWAEERDEQQILEDEEREKEFEQQREREGESVQQRHLVVGVGRGEGASAVAA